MHVLVAAAREVHQQDRLLRQAARQLGGMGERMRGFKRRDDAFAAAQLVKCAERFVVGHRDIFEPPPTQAITASGCRPASSCICGMHSSPITDWKSRTIIGYGCGPATVPMM